MKIKFLTILLLAVAAAACSKAVNPAGSDAAPAPDITGRWLIESIVFNDSDYVRPAECVPGVEQSFTFTDSTYHVATNCNSMGGYYAIEGDSIMLGDGPMTEMACDNMDTEDALRRIMPGIVTVCLEGDSTMRLCTSSTESYILLKKGNYPD